MPPRQPDILAVMKAVPAFAQLDQPVLLSILADCQVMRYAPDVPILPHGRVAREFYIVLEGQVKVFKSSPSSGAEQILYVVGPGQSFGEAAMWAQTPFPAQAQATRPATVLVAPRSALMRALARNLEVAAGMLAGLSAKLQEFNRLIARLSLQSVPARVAGLLLDLSDQAGSTTIRLPQTKRELAKRMGATPETFSRVLSGLRRRGVIQMRGATISIVHDEALLEMAQED